MTAGSELLVDSDTALLERARQGDGDAFSDLVRPHREALVRAAYAVLGNEQDALDAAQDALLRTFRHLATYDGRASFLTWARRIATNCALDRLAQRKREKTTGLPEDDALAAPREAATHSLERDEERAIVRAAIAELPPAQRAAVLLRDVEGLSYEEISKALGIPKGTVMSRIYYGRETLKERLGRRLGERAP